MTNLAKLPTWSEKNTLHAVVDTPRGSHAKLEYDPKLKVFTLAKPLMAGLTYPYESLQQAPGNNHESQLLRLFQHASRRPGKARTRLSRSDRDFDKARAIDALVASWRDPGSGSNSSGSDSNNRSGLQQPTAVPPDRTGGSRQFTRISTAPALSATHPEARRGPKPILILPFGNGRGARGP
jgi:hypothetical protein